MSHSKLTTKGQITIPKKLRDELKLKAGDRVNFALHNNEIVITPATSHINELAGFINYSGSPVSLEDMDAAIQNSIIAED